MTRERVDRMSRCQWRRKLGFRGLTRHAQMHASGDAEQDISLLNAVLSQMLRRNRCSEFLHGQGHERRRRNVRYQIKATQFGNLGSPRLTVLALHGSFLGVLLP